MTRNRFPDGRPRPGRPPGSDRSQRPWDRRDEHALRVVAANPDRPRYQIAAALGLSLAALSNTTCSPRGRERLAELERTLTPAERSALRLPPDRDRR